MKTLPEVKLTHLGLWVHDLDRMVAFYTRFFGFTLSDRGETRGHRVAFLTLDPDSHHQVVMEDGRPDKVDFNTIQQISFKTNGLAGVRAYWKALQSEPVTGIRPITHGNAWSVYFQDPEDNRTEIYCDTPWHVAQPFGVEIDYSLSEAEIMRITQDMIRNSPTYSSFEEFRRETARKIGATRAPASAK